MSIVIPDYEKIQYYLENGEEIDYVYTFGTDVSVTTHIQNLADLYVTKTIHVLPQYVYVRPELYHSLLRSLMAYERYMPSSPIDLNGYQTFSFATAIGILQVVVIQDLYFPIFIGTPRGYEEGNFNRLMDRVLNNESNANW